MHTNRKACRLWACGPAHSCLAKIRRKTGIVYQQNCLDDIMTVRENLMYRGILHGASRREARSQCSKLGEILKYFCPYSRNGRMSSAMNGLCSWENTCVFRWPVWVGFPHLGDVSAFSAANLLSAVPCIWETVCCPESDVITGLRGAIK